MAAFTNSDSDLRLVQLEAGYTIDNASDSQPPPYYSLVRKYPISIMPYLTLTHYQQVPTTTTTS